MSDDSGPQPMPAAPDDGRYHGGEADGRDARLDRAVAIRRVPPDGADALERAACFLARLDHDGLPCIHDFVRDAAGARLVERPQPGRSLVEAVAAAAAGEEVPAIADAIACAVTFLRLCEALEAAHRHGVVHGAIAADRIRIGAAGEVVLAGWERAMAAEVRPLTRRIAAGAPPTGRLPPDGLQGDLRALGLCLATALLREAPACDPAGRLVAGDGRIPLPLLAVVRRAMASDAAVGYASAAELRDDLARFLAGNAPRAWQPGPATRVRLWLGRHRRAALVTAALLTATVATTLALAWPQVSTYAAWGPPLVHERFDDNAWKGRWDVRGGPSGPAGWDVRDGRLVSTADYDTYLVLRQRLSPPVAIEYTGRMRADARPGDLSVWWCEGEAMAPGRERLPFSQPGWFVQAGAYENSWCSLYQVPGGRRLAVANRRLQPGVDHRFRVEIEDTRVCMWVDGELTIDHQGLLPAVSGNLGLYAYFPGKEFDEVRVWQRGVPELISPLAIGDEAYRAGRFADAAAAYGRVVASHAGRPLGQRALWLRGIALRRSGDRDAAAAAWERLADPLLRQRADCLAVDDLAEAGEVALACARFRSLWEQRPAVHPELRERWQTVGQHLLDRRTGMAEWYAVRTACFPADRASAWLAAELLLRLQRWEDLVRDHAEERRPYSAALLALGRGQELLASDWALSDDRIHAMYAAGTLAAALASPSIHRDMRYSILCKLGRAQELLDSRRETALVHLGRAQELLDGSGSPDAVRLALLATGRWAEAAGDGLPRVPGSGGSAEARLLLGRVEEPLPGGEDPGYHRLITALAAGDLEAARRLRPQAHGNRDGRLHARWFGAGPGLGLADAVLGDAAALRRALERGAGSAGVWGGRLQAVCRDALAADGGAAVAALEWATEREALAALARALRAELAGDAAAARAAWQAYAALPMHLRLLDENLPNQEIEATVRWRLAALGG